MHRGIQCISIGEGELLIMGVCDLPAHQGQLAVAFGFSREPPQTGDPTDGMLQLLCHYYLDSVFNQFKISV